VKKGEMGGACCTYGEMRSAYKIMFRKPDREKRLGDLLRRWDLEEIGYELE
jgi:hypothetical protein